MPFTCY